MQSPLSQPGGAEGGVNQLSHDAVPGGVNHGLYPGRKFCTGVKEIDLERSAGELFRVARTAALEDLMDKKNYDELFEELKYSLRGGWCF